MACTISAEEIKRVKSLGFLNNKGSDLFNGRVITGNGKVTAKDAKVIAEAAERFGSGELAFTTRLTVEVVGIPYENIEPFCAFLAEHGLQTGGTGTLVRPIVSCKGATCQYGLYNTYELADVIHNRFYLGYRNVKLPHKFKIAAGGCPNNCVKPELNDVGVIGQMIPQLDKALCKGCKKCKIEAICPMKAAAVENDVLHINKELCKNCGRCVGKCPFGVIETGKKGYKLAIGGRWGKKIAHAKSVSKVFTTQEELLDAIETCILLFREQGVSGERFADTIARIGFEAVEQQVLGNELLKRKDAIIRG